MLSAAISGARLSGSGWHAKFAGKASRTWGSIAGAACLALLAGGLACQQAVAEDSAHLSKPSEPPSWLQAAAPIPPAEPQVATAPGLKQASFLGEPASTETRQMADWVIRSGDNLRQPFVIIDKKEAKLFVFDSEGRLRGAAPALLGVAQGDDSVPGIGNRKLASIRPEERTTPAGRFVAALGRDLGQADIIWVDYESALSLHRVITSNRKERRLERLMTASPLDNRISFGCINVPVNFYETVVKPAFTGTSGIVYILPEVRSIRDVFAAYEAEERFVSQIEAAPSPDASGQIAPPATMQSRLVTEN